MPASPTTLDLGDLELFADCTRSQLQRIRALSTGIRISAGQPLIREGGLATEFIVLRSGSALVTRETRDGVVQVAELGAGDIMGEMALLNGIRRTATVTAVTDVDVLVSSIAEFRSIMEIAPSVAQKVRSVSSSRTTGMAAAA